MTINQLPFVSIVIPTFNEAEYLAKCITSLQQLNYPKDLYEITLVDNGSVDNTVEIAKSFDISVYVKEKVKVGAVRNYGASKSKGAIYAFIDGDCVASPNWLSAAIEKLSSDVVGAVGGAYLLRDDPSWVESGWVISQETITEESASLVGGSFIVKADIFNEISGFDESINAGEDTKLAREVAVKNQVWKVSECAVIHLGYPNTIKGFFRRQFWHASSYRKSNLGLLNDKVYLLVVLFTLSFFAGGLYWLVNIPWLIYSMTFIVVSPLLFSLNRIMKVGITKYVIKNLPYILTLDFIYFIARSSALVTSYFCDPFKK
jgi:glycosyltransferase involved in cell wall biosynthesis